MIKTVSRLLAAILACLMLVGLAACAKKNEPQNTALNTEQPARTQAPSNTQNPNSQGRNDGSNIGTKVTEAPADATQKPAEGGSHVIGPAGPSTYVISSEECFPAYGFTCFKAGKSTSLDVMMNSGGGKVEWSVYVLDEEFEEGARYIPQAYEPVMTDSGALTVEAGQYVYIHCSVNNFTADEPAHGASISFTGEGLPKK